MTKNKKSSKWLIGACICIFITVILNILYVMKLLPDLFEKIITWQIGTLSCGIGVLLAFIHLFHLLDRG